MPLYSEEQLEELEEGRAAVQSKYETLLGYYHSRTYKTHGGCEFALHGFSRRIGVMARCIENTFSSLPLAENRIPDREQLLDATVNIQSFIYNAYGCCENLAWVWVYEKNIQTSDGQPLSRNAVGFRKSNKAVWRSLPIDFRKYLQSLEMWFDYLKDFRDGLAHRIPLYIPPYMVDPSNLDKYKALEQRKRLANRTFNEEVLKAVENDMAEIQFFKPLMTHSVFEEPSLVSFHSQLLADFNTIEEIATKFHKIL